MTLLSAVFAHDRTRFGFGNRSILVTSPADKQKGYNVDNASVQVKDNIVVFMGRFKYLHKGAAIVATNWRLLHVPAYTAREQMMKGFTTRENFMVKDAFGNPQYLRFELDEQTEREFMVWLDERAEQES